MVTLKQIYYSFPLKISYIKQQKQQFFNTFEEKPAQMFFVNPHYQLSKLTPQQNQKNFLQLKSILQSSPEQRHVEDWQLMYYYFHKHKFFIDLQSSKSLRAKILAISKIELITEKQYVDTISVHFDIVQNSEPKKKYKVLERFASDNNKLVVLDLKKKQEIMNQDESYIKEQISYLKTFSLLNKMQYHQLLYLAHFIERQSVSYKNFLFKQGQPVQYIYLIQEGQFQLSKKIQKQPGFKLSPLKHSVVEQYMESEISQFKIKTKKFTRENISTIQGGSGQSVGEVEFFLEMPIRQFAIKCNSTNSSLKKISVQHFKQVFKNNSLVFKKLKHQFEKKYAMDIQKLTRDKMSKNSFNQETRFPSTMKKSKSKNNRNLSRVINQMEKNRYQSLRTQQLQEKQFILNHNKISATIDVSNHRNMKQRNLKSEMLKKDQKKFQEKLNKMDTKSSKNPHQYISIDQPFFPILNNKKSMGKSIQVVRRKPKRAKALVDIAALIKQKQQVSKIKSIQNNPQFSFYKNIDKRNKMRLNKLHSAQKNEQISVSPVHSDIYMKNLLKQSLKKSGYVIKGGLQQNPQSQETISLNRKQGSERYLKQDKFPTENQEHFHISQFFDQKQQRYEGLLNNKQRISLVKNNFDNFFRRL